MAGVPVRDSLDNRRLTSLVRSGACRVSSKSACMALVLTMLLEFNKQACVTKNTCDSAFGCQRTRGHI